MTPTTPFDETEARDRLQAAVGDAYEVGRLLGRGGFAEVFEARDPALRRLVAVKTLRADMAASPAGLERFQREARAIARLRHPHVVDVYTVGERDGVAYYVMPLIEGRTLAALMEGDEPIDPAEAERILIESAAGLAAAHRAGIVHRDVKPENILLDGEERRVVLTDFGIARALESDQSGLTGTRMVMGTPRYLSPEQAAGDPVDQRADLYALGVVGYQMVAGRPPFEAPTAQALIAKHLTQEPVPLATVCPACPEGLARVVDRCLAKDPDERWPDAAALIGALRGEERVEAGASGAEGRGAREGMAPAAAAAGWGAAAAPVGDTANDVEQAAGASAYAGAAVLARHRRRLVAAGVVALGAVGVERLVTGGIGFSLAVVLVAGSLAAAWLGLARREGWSLVELLRPSPAAGTSLAQDVPGASQFGRYEEVVRNSRSCRGHILRLFHTLSRAERERFPGLAEAVDAVALGIKKDARRLATLEAREEEAEGASRRGMTPTGSGVVLGELSEARERILGDLNEQVEALEQIRHWLVRSGGADSEAVHDQLLASVERAEAAARRREV